MRARQNDLERLDGLKGLVSDVVQPVAVDTGPLGPNEVGGEVDHRPSG